MEKDEKGRQLTRGEQHEELEDRADLDAVREALAEVGPNISWERLKAELNL